MASKFLEEILSKEELSQIIVWYRDENVSLREIEKRCGRGRAAISRMLTRLGIKQVNGNHYRKYFFNFKFFKSINNELSAYWLGFLYADGCIETPREYGEQTFKIAIAQQDEELLQKFKLDIGSTYPIRYDYSKHNKNPEHQVYVIQQLRSQETIEDLKALGCIERKSLTLKFPTKEQVPDKFMRDFIRGYFDGDGSISIYEGKGRMQAIISFVGTEDFIKGLYSILKKGSVFPDKRRQNSWYLSIGGNLQVIELYHYLYDGATRFMERKYQKFQPLLLKYDENQGVKE